MAQSVAKLQTPEQATKQKTSPAAPHRTTSSSRADSVPPRSPERAAQLPPPPALHPVPPMPVPP
jgi:hypothetical protein